MFISRIILFADSDAEVLLFENFGLQNIVTPVDTKQLRMLLCRAGYDKAKTKMLLDGFQHGFSLGYQGPKNSRIVSPNLKFRGVGNKSDFVEQGYERS